MDYQGDTSVRSTSDRLSPRRLVGKLSTGLMDDNSWIQGGNNNNKRSGKGETIKSVERSALVGRLKGNDASWITNNTSPGRKIVTDDPWLRIKRSTPGGNPGGETWRTHNTGEDNINVRVKPVIPTKSHPGKLHINTTDSQSWIIKSTENINKENSNRNFQRPAHPSSNYNECSISEFKAMFESKSNLNDDLLEDNRSSVKSSSKPLGKITAKNGEGEATISSAAKTTPQSLPVDDKTLLNEKNASENINCNKNVQSVDQGVGDGEKGENLTIKEKGENHRDSLDSGNNSREAKSDKDISNEDTSRERRRRRRFRYVNNEKDKYGQEEKQDQHGSGGLNENNGADHSVSEDANMSPVDTDHDKISRRAISEDTFVRQDSKDNETDASNENVHIVRRRKRADKSVNLEKERKYSDEGETKPVSESPVEQNHSLKIEKILVQENIVDEEPSIELKSPKNDLAKKVSINNTSTVENEIIDNSCDFQPEQNMLKRQSEVTVEGVGITERASDNLNYDQKIKETGQILSHDLEQNLVFEEKNRVNKIQISKSDVNAKVDIKQCPFTDVSESFSENQPIHNKETLGKSNFVDPSHEKSCLLTKDSTEQIIKSNEINSDIIVDPGSNLSDITAINSTKASDLAVNLCENVNENKDNSKQNISSNRGEMERDHYVSKAKPEADNKPQQEDARENSKIEDSCQSQLINETNTPDSFKQSQEKYDTCNNNYPLTLAALAENSIQAPKKDVSVKNVDLTCTQVETSILNAKRQENTEETCVDMNTSQDNIDICKDDSGLSSEYLISKSKSSSLQHAQRLSLREYIDCSDRYMTQSDKEGEINTNNAKGISTCDVTECKKVLTCEEEHNAFSDLTTQESDGNKILKTKVELGCEGVETITTSPVQEKTYYQSLKIMDSSETEDNNHMISDPSQLEESQKADTLSIEQKITLEEKLDGARVSGEKEGAVTASSKRKFSEVEKEEEEEEEENNTKYDQEVCASRDQLYLNQNKGGLQSVEPDDNGDKTCSSGNSSMDIDMDKEIHHDETQSSTSDAQSKANIKNKYVEPIQEINRVPNNEKERCSTEITEQELKMEEETKIDQKELPVVCTGESEIMQEREESTEKSEGEMEENSDQPGKERDEIAEQLGYKEENIEQFEGEEKTPVQLKEKNLSSTEIELFSEISPAAQIDGRDGSCETEFKSSESQEEIKDGENISVKKEENEVSNEENNELKDIQVFNESSPQQMQKSSSESEKPAEDVPDGNISTNIQVPSNTDIKEKDTYNHVTEEVEKHKQSGEKESKNSCQETVDHELHLIETCQELPGLDDKRIPDNNEKEGFAKDDKLIEFNEKKAEGFQEGKQEGTVTENLHGKQNRKMFSEIEANNSPLIEQSNSETGGEGKSANQLEKCNPNEAEIGSSFEISDHDKQEESGFPDVNLSENEVTTGVNIECKNMEQVMSLDTGDSKSENFDGKHMLSIQESLPEMEKVMDREITDKETISSEEGEKETDAQAGAEVKIETKELFADSSNEADDACNSRKEEKMIEVSYDNRYYIPVDYSVLKVPKCYRLTPQPAMMNGAGDVHWDHIIFEVFEESESLFFPIQTQKDARSFVKALHIKGLGFDAICKEVGENEHNFNSWRKSLGRTGVGNSVMHWANGPMQDLLDDSDDNNYSLDKVQRKAEKKSTKPADSSPKRNATTSKKIQSRADELKRERASKTKEEQKEVESKQNIEIKEAQTEQKVKESEPKETSPKKETKEDKQLQQKYEQEPDPIRMKQLEKFKQENSSGDQTDEDEDAKDVRKRIFMFENKTSPSRNGSEPREMANDETYSRQSNSNSISGASSGSTSAEEETRDIPEPVAGENLSTIDSKKKEEPLEKVTDEKEQRSEIKKVSDEKEKQPEVQKDVPAKERVEKESAAKEVEKQVTVTQSKEQPKVEISENRTNNTTAKKEDQANGHASSESDNSVRKSADVSTPSVDENYNSDLDPENDMQSPMLAAAVKKISGARSNKNWSGFLYVFSDTPGNSETCRVKVGVSAFPHKRLRQAQLFNPSIYQVKIMAVKQRSSALEDVMKELEPYTMPNQKDWFEGPFNELLEAISGVASKYPSSRKLLSRENEEGGEESAC